jgi:hypothetical protein
LWSWNTTLTGPAKHWMGLRNKGNQKSDNRH